MSPATRSASAKARHEDTHGKVPVKGDVSSRAAGRAVRALLLGVMSVACACSCARRDATRPLEPTATREPVAQRANGPAQDAARTQRTAAPAVEHRDVLCSAILGRPVRSDARCTFPLLPAQAPRIYTLEVKSRVAQCVATTDPDAKCADLSTNSEREICAFECKERVEYHQIQEEAEACAARAREYLAVRCHAPPVGFHNYSARECEQLCESLLRRRAVPPTTE
jgi:hypothetical protein